MAHPFTKGVDVSIEVREEKPSERVFKITLPPMADVGLLCVSLTEAELRELVEKGAKALGGLWVGNGVGKITMDQVDYYSREREILRLRAWLKAIEAEETYRKTAYMASKALAGEEAPKP